jgi:hypothetical protein
MRMRVRSIVVMMAAAVAAGCGDGDDGETPNVAPTSSAGLIATPTPAATPTETPTIPIEPCSEGSALVITARALPGAHLDLGWSGLWHDLAAGHGGSVSANLDCPGLQSCTLDGSSLVGERFGAPLPLSAGGVSLCVVNSFREAVTGTYDGCTGCGETSVKLTSRVFTAEDASIACPPCVGDPTPGDGAKDGTCSGGADPGAACDGGAIGSDFGTTSNDCVPSGGGIGDLALDLNPLATGTVTIDASVDCVSDAVGTGRCFCSGQVEPNACEPDGVCPASGVCELGPIDSVCDAQPFRSCRSGTGTEDCDARFPGAGSCVDRPRPCFGTQVARTGTCGTDRSDLVALFCVRATDAPAIDAMVGLPGPGTITLPVSVLRTPR